MLAVKNLDYLREDKHPGARSLEKEQTPFSVPFIGLVEIEVDIIDILNHPRRTN